MADLSVAVRRPRPEAFREFARATVKKLERAALSASDRAARSALGDLRTAMRGAGLGRLGNAIGAGSDAKKRGVVHQRGEGDFSASGWLFVRSQSPRTIGAVLAYTEGADIGPKQGRWLWIPTPEVPTRAGRYKMTPELWRKHGFDQKIGPLELVPNVNGRPLLVVRGAGINKRGRAQSRTKKGALRKGQTGKEFIVAFIGIPRTSRTARVNARAIIAATVARIDDFIGAAL